MTWNHKIDYFGEKGGLKVGGKKVDWCKHVRKLWYACGNTL